MFALQELRTHSVVFHFISWPKHRYYGSIITEERDVKHSGALGGLIVSNYTTLHHDVFEPCPSIAAIAYRYTVDFIRDPVWQQTPPFSLAHTLPVYIIYRLVDNKPFLSVQCTHRRRHPFYPRTSYQSVCLPEIVQGAWTSLWNHLFLGRGLQPVVFTYRVDKCCGTRPNFGYACAKVEELLGMPNGIRTFPRENVHSLWPYPWYITKRWK